MKTFSFALASIRYRKSALKIYVIAAALALGGMIFCSTLFDSLKVLIHNSGLMFSLIERSRQLLNQETETIEALYDHFLFFIFAGFTLFFSVYSFYYQKKKKDEYRIWHTKGGTFGQWLMIQLIEAMLPLLIVAGVIFILLLFFQPVWQKILTNSQLLILDQQKSLAAVFQSLETNLSEHLIITVPQTNQAVSRSLALNSNEWLKLCFKSFTQVLVRLMTIIGGITVLITSGFSIHWRDQSCTQQKK